MKPVKHLRPMLVCTLVAFVAPAAHAELMKLIESSRGTAIYVDPAKVDRESDVRKVEEMWDYQEPDQLGNFSTRIEAEYDCPASARRILRVTGYPAQKWQGKATPARDNPDTSWKPVAPNTLAEAVMRGVCLK